MTATAVWPLHVALVAALEAVPLVSAPGVYQEGDVPRSASLPYYIVGGSVEPEDEKYFGQPGRSQEIQLKSWAKDRASAFALHAAATDLLDGGTLTLTGHVLVRMKLGHLADFKEQGTPPDKPGPYVVVGRLSTETVQA